MKTRQQFEITSLYQRAWFRRPVRRILFLVTLRPWHVTQEAVLHTNRHMFQRFRDSLPADTSGEDNLKTYALVEAAYASARLKQAVAPPAWTAKV